MLFRSAEQDGAHTPIVALTANASAEDNDACLAAGMDGFAVKPLDRERLVAALASSNKAARCVNVYYWNTILYEKRYPLFGIMLYSRRSATSST